MGWFRKPDVEVTVEPSPSETAAEAMGKWSLFGALCMNFGVEFVRAEGSVMTVKGRPKKIAAFKDAFEFLKSVGSV